MQPPRWRSSRPSPSTLASASPTSRTRASRRSTPPTSKAARDLDMVIRLVGAARLVDGSFDVRVEPALVDKQHPLAKVDGAFNAVMLQGDAIREITLEGPGRRRYRDRVGRDRRHGQRDRDDGHGLPAERRRVARAAAPAVGREQLAVLLPPLRRGPARARSRGSPTSSRSATSRSRASCSSRTATVPRCTSSRTRRARVRWPTRSRRSARCPRCTSARGPCR